MCYLVKFLILTSFGVNLNTFPTHNLKLSVFLKLWNSFALFTYQGGNMVAITHSILVGFHWVCSGLRAVSPCLYILDC